MVSAIGSWLNSNSFQLSCRSFLYCRPFGSAPVGAVAVVRNRKRSDEDVVILADLLANSGISHHAADNANPAGMRKPNQSLRFTLRSAPKVKAGVSLQSEDNDDLLLPRAKRQAAIDAVYQI